MFPNILRKSSKTFEEDSKMFRPLTNGVKHNLRYNLDISEIIDIFKSGDIEYATRDPAVVSYEFYEWCIFK